MRYRYIDWLNGDDANNGLSFDTAWKTFANAHDGDTLYAINAPPLIDLPNNATVYFGTPKNTVEPITVSPPTPQR